MRRARAWLMTCLATLAATACSDDLADPQTRRCDLTQTISVDVVPATVSYFVAVGGVAVLESVTYTGATGDTTLSFPPDEDPISETHLRSEFEFTTPTEATLNAMGEVAAGGQIGIAYNVVVGVDTTRSLPVVCAG